MIGPEDFEGLNGRAVQEPLVCSSCGRDDVRYEDSRSNGSMVGWCFKCEAHRDLLTDSEFLRLRPDNVVRTAVAKAVGEAVK